MVYVFQTPYCCHADNKKGASRKPNVFANIHFFIQQNNLFSFLLNQISFKKAFECLKKTKTVHLEPTENTKPAYSHTFSFCASHAPLVLREHAACPIFRALKKPNRNLLGFFVLQEHEVGLRELGLANCVLQLSPQRGGLIELHSPRPNRFLGLVKH